MRTPQPRFELGNLVRDQVRVATAEHPAPKFSDLYQLDEQPLGEGRYSCVYAATHRSTGARRAVKTALRRGPSAKIVDLGMECPGRLARHEADILKSVDHPNVIRLYEIYDEKEAVHLVLELCEGSDVLERILVSKGRLPEHEISLLFVQMLFAAGHLHSRGVVHRDLKPEHFLFTRREPDHDPNPPKVAALKVIDFGLSHKEGATFTPLGGTPQFMPPEIVNGQAQNRELSDRVDMWALGVVLHAMLVGHYPSAHLKDSTQSQYFGRSAWASTTKDCVDLLGQLLRQAPATRPTAVVALRHPWARRAIGVRGAVPEGLVSVLPAYLRAYSQAPGLQKLALLATAHELDDFGYYGLRILFQALLLESPEGVLTRSVLEKMAVEEGPVGKAASVLAKHFEPFAAGGIGVDVVLGWTEMLALTAGHGAKAVTPAVADGVPEMSEDACWRAFDVLSLGTGEISGSTLQRLLGVPRGPGSSTSVGAVASEGTGFSALVSELFPGGCAPREQFLNLLDGKVRVQRGVVGVRGVGGFVQCFACWARPRAAGDGLSEGRV